LKFGANVYHINIVASNNITSIQAVAADLKERVSQISEENADLQASLAAF